MHKKERIEYQQLCSSKKSGIIATKHAFLLTMQHKKKMILQPKYSKEPYQSLKKSFNS